MRTPRPPDSLFWVDPGAVAGGRLVLDERESHHLTHVFRATEGTRFEATDGAGRWFGCVFESLERRRAVGRIEATELDRGELGGALTLLVGQPETSAAENLVSIAVALGVTRLVFARSAHSAAWEPTAGRRGRLLRLARAALKQARRSRLPAIEWLESVPRALADLSAAARWLADQEGPPSLAAAVGPLVASAALGIGPPGGFTDPEREALRGSGFSPISLGPSRLTTELAAAAGLAIIRNRLINNSLGPV